MILFPAIDLKGGQCVRLLRGAMDSATVFNDDPAAQARQFADAGFAWLHVVDLDGAFAGRSENAAAIASILDAIDIPAQLGGGIRDMAAIDRWLDAGIARVILGTAAVQSPDLVRTACAAHPGRIAVGIDARAGRVAIDGWAETADITARDLALRLEDCGVAAIIHTDIDRDGAMGGPNVAASAALADAISTPVIVSGGVSSLADLETVRDAGADHNIAGVICGRALYDGRVDPAAGLAALRGAA